MIYVHTLIYFIVMGNHGMYWGIYVFCYLKVITTDKCKLKSLTDVYTSLLYFWLL